MGSRILIVTALKAELELPDVLFTGVGKINAAWQLAKALAQSRPELVINYGTAGGLSRGVSGLVEVARVIQDDIYDGRAPGTAW